MVQSCPVRPLTRDYGKGRLKLARIFDPSGAPSSPALRYDNNAGDSPGTSAELMHSRGGGAEVEAFEASRPQDCQQAEKPGGSEAIGWTRSLVWRRSEFRIKIGQNRKFSVSLGLSSS